MRWILAMALALELGVVGARTASAQMPPQCAAFMKLRDDARQKGMAIGEAEKRHAERKEICSLVTKYAAAEEAAVKFLEANKVWCGVPEQALAASKATHQKTLQFRTAACSEAPHPRAPTLSEAIGGVTVDSAKNTKTGHGTFDTLTGNPLARPSGQ